MRAAAVRAFRAPVEVMDLPPPEPHAGEVGVRIEAAGMNPFDWKIADGTFEGRRPHVFPLVLGVDGCGVVERVGAGVRTFTAGDRVVGSFLSDPVGRGTYAERSVVPESNAVVRVPAGLPPKLAAAVPTAGMTAVQSLDALGVSRGDRILLVGASGGIGSFAVQLARSRGVEVVAVARRASHERLLRLGAFAVIEPTAVDSEELRELSGAAGLDGLLDVASDAAGFALWARALKPGAAAASTIGAATPTPGYRAVAIDMQPSSRDLARLFAEVGRGAVTIPLERSIRLEDVPGAIAESRGGRSLGKTVVEP